MKKLGIFLIPIMFFVLLIGGCGSDTTKEKEEGIPPETSGEHPSGDLAPLDKKATVMIAEDGAASGAGFYIAKEKGYFDDYNIDVKFTQFANSDDMLPALAAGEIDIAGGVSTASFFNAIAQGIDVKIIADKGHYIKGDSYFSFVIREELKDEIKDYSDLKGKRVAVSSQNAVDDYIFRSMLEHAGLKESDVEFVLMSDFGNMLAAMGNGSIDAALQIEPLITQGIEQGLHVRLGDATDFAPDAQIAMVLGSPEFIEQETDVSLRFMAAYLKGVRDYNDAFIKGEGKEEVIDIMTKHTALKDPALWEKVAITGLDPNGRMFTKDIKKQYEMYKENGAIRGEFDFETSIDTSMTEKAVEVLGEYK
ncbi:taurine ABC transporter substrate-binding protein [Halobacillus halophilus]|uniref:ABC-type transport system extracellular binding protein (Probable substrate sulfonate/nitrate/taurine) n=1 Tax=Halobacillus halophilus (strain ATCC 35676 / DSM 2266 / JCM 20832 / KCTC 3685 / LMG 17431 / NBRC 102448 / NCIMB 2269) TaxID=866895 RepID=I0JIV8_HALH3|nr:ABC transporter substrate-binding protein [Halobacillus halophilus]ASF38247.1 taurine ABC transporter substrate-binding protein [Halobacillus halophilus]CCG44076.1 ABC-type transport system extracellular binding protein (probable substrate sulfonate/nitrate/taurine) [Halobacillus halophilus DSM 2266]